MNTKKIFRSIILVLGIITFSFTCIGIVKTNSIEDTTLPRIETFTFSSDGVDFKGKIFIPALYETNKNLPAIFLIDFTEQHYKLATNEFEKVIDGVQQLQNFDALVVSLEEIADIDAEPEDFQEHYNIYKNMALYVDGKYTKNQSRTFIGKGSESGVVLMTLFVGDTETSVFENFIVTDPSPLYASAIIKMIENEDFPKKNRTINFIFLSLQVMTAPNALN